MSRLHSEGIPGAIPYRKDVFKEYAEYSSLTVSEMKSEDRNFALKKIAKINTGIEAKSFAVKEGYTSLGIPTGPEAGKWTYSDIDLHGRVGILKYKGIEIALFIHRQLSPHRITPDTPISEMKLKNPDDAWMKLDLTGLSARQARRPTMDIIRNLERENDTLKKRITLKEAIIHQLEAGDSHGKKKKRKAKIAKKNRKASKRRHSMPKSRSRKDR